MKNLTRILALVLVFTMMVSSAAFAAKFTDVAEGSTYAEAVEVLSALGILKGDTDGTFRPEDVITRAEVVAVINRLQGLSEAAKAAAGTSMYTDVATTEWYAGDVNLASQQGIIKGDGNGLFRPNDQVKYEEAVKMMVAALGYKEEYVLKQGGWPTGYLVIATENEITKGLSVSAGEPAHRGIVAKLAYQTLTAPLMVLAEYDDDGKATWKPNPAKTLLGEKLGMAMAQGHVSTNDVSSLTGSANNKKGYVDFKVDYTETEVTDAYGEAKVKNVYKYFDGNNTELVIAKDQIGDINVGETDIAETLGYAVKAFFELNDDDEVEVLVYVKNDKNNATAVIENAQNIVLDGKYYTKDDLKVEEAAIDGTLSVYDEEVDSTDTEYKLDKANIIYNGKYMAAEKIADIKPVFGSVELLDNDKDGEYEYAFITSYETRVVDSIYNDNKTIGCKIGSKIELEDHIKGKDGCKYSIELDGEEIAITDLQEDDVISVAASKDKKTVKILVSRKVVEGAIESIDKSNEALKTVYSIGGNDYKLAYLANSDDYPELDVTTEGKFYIDAFGRIAKTEADSSIAGNLAFIKAFGDYESMEETHYEMEVLNKDGSVVVYNLADEVYVKANNVAAKIEDGALVEDKEAGKQDKELVAEYIATLLGEDSSEAYAYRLVTYKANASGKITSISFVVAGDPDAEKQSGLQFFAGLAEDKYDESVNSLKYGVTESTTVFYLPIVEEKDKEGNKIVKAKKDDFEVTTVSMLVDDKAYNTAYLDLDKDGNAGVMIITSDSISIADGAALAVVTGSTITTDDEGDKVISVSFLQNGEAKTLTVDSEADVNIIGEDNPFERGAIFEYSVNAEGNIDDADFKGVGNTIAFTPAEVQEAALAGDVFETKKADEPKDFQYIAGYVVTKSGSTLGLATSPFAKSGAKVNIPDSANIYVMDVTRTKINPAEASIGDVTKVLTYTEEGEDYLEEDEDTYVIIKYVDKTIVDVVAYKGLNFVEFE